MGRSQKPIYSDQQKKHVFTSSTLRRSCARGYVTPQFIAPPNMTRQECKNQIVLNQVAQRITWELQRQKNYQPSASETQDLMCLFGKKCKTSIEELTTKEKSVISSWASTFTYHKDIKVNAAKRLQTLIWQCRHELEMCEKFGIGSKLYYQLTSTERTKLQEIASNQWLNVYSIKNVFMTENEAIKARQRKLHRQEAWGDRGYWYYYYSKNETQGARRSHRRSAMKNIPDWENEDDLIAFDIFYDTFRLDCEYEEYANGSDDGACEDDDALWLDDSSSSDIDDQSEASDINFRIDEYDFCNDAPKHLEITANKQPCRIM